MRRSRGIAPSSTGRWPAAPAEKHSNATCWTFCSPAPYQPVNAAVLSTENRRPRGKFMFFGSIPALATPFSGGRVAQDTFRELVEWQISEGSNGLVPCGTTGESATMSSEEQRRVIEIAVEAARGRVPVIAGCGSNNVAHAIDYLHAAKEVGADAALVVMGYYNRPSQAGMIAAFKALSEASALPIIVYNIPGRAVVDISVETLAEIAKLPNIAGVKDATGNLGRVTDQRL